MFKQIFSPAHQSSVKKLIQKMSATKIRESRDSTYLIIPTKNEEPRSIRVDEFGAYHF